MPDPSRRPRHDKQSFKLPVEMVEEMRLEAARLERSISWIAQESWRRARSQLRKLPSPR